MMGFRAPRRDGERRRLPVRRVDAADAPRWRTKKFPEETLKADTIIVSCGMLNFESSAYANGSSTEFKDWHSTHKVETSHFEKYPEARDKFIKSFKKNRNQFNAMF